MLEFAGMNYWAVAAAWIITAVVGALWYSPVGFANQWTKQTGVNILEMPENEATGVLGSVIFAALIHAIVLAVVINSLGAATVGEALVAGVVLWAGFTGATTVGNSLYSRFGWKFWWLNNSYFLLVVAVNSAVLVSWT